MGTGISGSFLTSLDKNWEGEKSQKTPSPPAPEVDDDIENMRG